MMLGWYKIFGLVFIFGLFFSGFAKDSALSQEIYLTPRDVNANAAQLDGQEVFVRGYVSLGTNSRSLFQSEERYKQLLQDWEEYNSDLDINDSIFEGLIEKYDDDCLTLLNTDLIYENISLFIEKTITVKGVVLANYMDGTVVDLQACGRPALILDEEYLELLLVSLRDEE